MTTTTEDEIEFYTVQDPEALAGLPDGTKFYEGYEIRDGRLYDTLCDEFNTHTIWPSDIPLTVSNADEIGLTSTHGFEVGDRVVLTGTSYVGRTRQIGATGEVVGIMPWCALSIKVSIDAENDIPLSSWSFSPDQLRKINFTAEPAFKVGDRVQLVSTPYLGDDGLGAGATGTVREVAPSRGWQYDLDMDEHGLPGVSDIGWGFNEEHLTAYVEPVQPVEEDPEPFEVGDTVFITAQSHEEWDHPFEIGAQVTITDSDYSLDGTYFVAGEFDGDEYEEYVHYTELSAKQPEQPSVGDRITSREQLDSLGAHSIVRGSGYVPFLKDSDGSWRHLYDPSADKTDRLVGYLTETRWYVLSNGNDDPRFAE